MIGKCSECGNTFKIDVSSDGDIVTCPICEATYKAANKNGKIKLEAFIYEDDDLSELVKIHLFKFWSSHRHCVCALKFSLRL